ncbi:Indoleamine 2,3-dioxygenase [Neolentinus lepideus HHB14362 ss-1]|uniref:Indoleamine 2,3-dioxygenase n=1 Tax=Neolentinus lepideus HHB14362 ss-1 TaxID=1314782 RepID=A0A165LKP1_9AGAM|nr:Indoleamine 2,3-dioxygenase [Neolentinus lepideus HHB14362 ss-1]KZT30304.1 Indoleamine 2,3-dioxygenase [Neolentinus lepideus HHB14362 ss-1]
MKGLVLSVSKAAQYILFLFLGVAVHLKRSVQGENWRQPWLPQEYGIDEISGFLPPAPLPKLPAEFRKWEDALIEAQKELSLGIDESPHGQSRRTSGARWRDCIKTWPILNTDGLDGDIRFLQRAHMVLAYLVHFFAHSQPQADAGQCVLVPRSIAIPLTAVSRKLGIAPILTFADVVLWNWTVANSDLPLSADNIRHEIIFSGREDERSFYAKCAAVELQAAEALKIINQYCELPGVDDPEAITKIAEDLRNLADIVKGLKQVLESIREVVDPHTYYHEIRHWWKGSGSKEVGSPLWRYEGVDGSEILDLSGPSAGQSPAMHAIDMFLDVDHRLTEKRSPQPSASDRRADRGFMERMRRYMQKPHREYLEYMANMPYQRRVRQVAARHPKQLRNAYNEAVMALKAFRDAHIRVACLYIITMSNSEDASAPGANAKSSRGPARGTGGMEVSALLKASRNATSRTILS